MCEQNDPKQGLKMMKLTLKDMPHTRLNHILKAIMEESNEDDKKSQIKKEQVNGILIQSSLVNTNTQY